MKTIFSLISISIVILLTLSNCHPNKVDSGEKIFNEVKNADNIFGLFDLKLGLTTIKDLKKNSKSQLFSVGELEPDYSSGKYRLDISEYSEKYEHERILRKNLRVQQYCFFKYDYNKLSISDLSVFFLDNILVGINVNSPGFSEGFSLIDDFKKKYGEGVGKESWNYVMKWNPKFQSVDQSFKGEFGGYEYEGHRDEVRVWKNSKIEVKYDGQNMTYTLINEFSKFDTLMREALESEVKKYRESKSKEIKSSI